MKGIFVKEFSCKVTSCGKSIQNSKGFGFGYVYRGRIGSIKFWFKSNAFLSEIKFGDPVPTIGRISTPVLEESQLVDKFGYVKLALCGHCDKVSGRGIKYSRIP